MENVGVTSEIVDAASTPSEFTEILKNISVTISTAEKYLEEATNFETKNISENILGSLEFASPLKNEKLQVDDNSKMVTDSSIEEKANKCFEISKSDSQVSPQSVKDNSKIRVNMISVLGNESNEAPDANKVESIVVNSDTDEKEEGNKIDVVKIESDTNPTKLSTENHGAPLIHDIRQNIFANNVSKKITPGFCARGRPHLWMALLSKRRH